MNKNEYYWITMHKAGEANKELQEQDFFVLMGKLNRMMLDGWEIQYGKLFNRRMDNEI